MCNPLPGTLTECKKNETFRKFHKTHASHACNVLCHLFLKGKVSVITIKILPVTVFNFWHLLLVVQSKHSVVVAEEWAGF